MLLVNNTVTQIDRVNSNTLLHTPISECWGSPFVTFQSEPRKPSGMLDMFQAKLLQNNHATGV